jgi:hypothetical protein
MPTLVTKKVILEDDPQAAKTTASTASTQRASLDAPQRLLARWTSGMHRLDTEEGADDPMRENWRRVLIDAVAVTNG